MLNMHALWTSLSCTSSPTQLLLGLSTLPHSFGDISIIRRRNKVYRRSWCHSFLSHTWHPRTSLRLEAGAVDWFSSLPQFVCHRQLDDGGPLSWLAQGSMLFLEFRTMHLQPSRMCPCNHPSVHSNQSPNMDLIQMFQRQGF